MLFMGNKPLVTENNFKEVYHTAGPHFPYEPGVINYQLSKLEADGTRFVTYEKFRNEDALLHNLNFVQISPFNEYLNASMQKQPFQAGLLKLKELVLHISSSLRFEL